MESLTTVAEIGIALAGFSGLVVVLRKNTGPLNELEKFRMSVLLAAAFGAMFLAMLPSGLQQLVLQVRPCGECRAHFSRLSRSFSISDG